ncbi:MAG TPA: rhomboid family intramembrane serine protease [Spirochaetota bacterium]|nr:rhomboid family intramembrane serine protease [Spirochaetota bacterium]
MMHGRNVQFRIGGPPTPTVKALMIVNGAVFLLQTIAGWLSPGMIEAYFGINHVGLIHQFMLWQPFTYMFLHGGFFHILFNLLALWMFGGDLEERWGKALFLRYYIFSGIGAGLFIALMNYFVFITYNASPVTIGASGAIYAILLAYGLTWPDREVLLYFIIPIKMKYLVLIFGGIEFFGTLASARGDGSGVSHIGHLGGLISGFIFIMWKLHGPRSATTSAQRSEGVIASFFKKERLKKKQKEIDTRIKAKAVIDRLLEKIAREGMGSLTPAERKELDWARKNYYPDDSATYH